MGIERGEAMEEKEEEETEQKERVSNLAVEKIVRSQSDISLSLAREKKRNGCIARNRVSLLNGRERDGERGTEREQGRKNRRQESQTDWRLCVRLAYALGTEFRCDVGRCGRS
jgi:hypothetical protein